MPNDKIIAEILEKLALNRLDRAWRLYSYARMTGKESFIRNAEKRIDEAQASLDAITANK